MAKARADVIEVRQRVAMVRSLIAQGTAVDVIIDWCTTEMQADPARGIQAKPWKVSRQMARNYINRALESMDAEVGKQTKARKTARNRAMITMIIQKALANGTPAALAVALKGADQLCKIDGSYDPSQLGPIGGIVPATPEEAVNLIEHAHATLELARARGAIAALPAGKPPAVIDIETDDGDDTADEVDEHDDAAN